MKLEPVGLDTLADGAALELFKRELERVLLDVDDVNTLATAERTITLTVTLAPAESREAAAIRISCKSKLGKAKVVDGVVHLAEHDGKRVALGKSPNQMDAFTTVEGGQT